MSWDQAIRDTGYMAVLKGAPDLNAAMKSILAKEEEHAEDLNSLLMGMKAR